MKYKAERIIIKVFPELSLVFLDEKTIWAFPLKDSRAYIFHNWWAPRFNYRDNWLPFKKTLLKRRYLDKEICWRIAAQYNIPYKTAESHINLGNKMVEIRYKRWTMKGCLCDAEKNQKELKK